MSYASNTALKEYQQMNARSAIEGADPHRLILMLMEGALDKIALAKGFMERGIVAEKGRHISWAISIVDGLRDSLDMDAGQDLAQNLDDLYEYMGRRLLEANINNSPEMLDEVAGLIREIKEAWIAIPQEARTEHAERQQAKAAGA